MSNHTPRQSTNMWQALGLAWELGYTIAIPLVLLALGGRFLDKWLGTSPWFLLTGVLLSIIITTWLIYRKTKMIVSVRLSAANKVTDKD